MIEILTLGYLSGKLTDKILDKPLDKGIDNFFEKRREIKRIQEIHTIINKFNEKFVNTEIDNKNFQDYLSLPEIQELMYSQIFEVVEVSISKEELVKMLVKDAYQKMNKVNKEKNWPLFTNTDLLEEYFEKTMDYLINIRDSLLSDSEKVQLNIIQTYIYKLQSEILLKLQEINLGIENDFTRREIDRKFNLLESKKEEIDGIDYKTIIGNIAKIMDEKMDMTSYKRSDENIQNVESNFYKLFYDSILDFGYEKIKYENQFYKYFEEFLYFINKIESKISKTELEYKLSNLMGLLKKEQWTIFVYYQIFLGNKEMLLLIDKFLLEKRPIFAPPLDITKERSFWRYIMNTGDLDPYPLNNRRKN